MDTELEELRKSCISKLYLCTDNVIKYLENNKEEELAKLRSHMTNYCFQEKYPAVIEQASERIKNDFDASNDDRIEERIIIYLKGIVDKINVKSHPSMLELDKKINRGNRIAENLDESDLAITNTNEPLIDSLTKKQIQDPVRNTYCGHIYERESILSHLNFRKNKTLCPVVGCGNKEPIRQEHLVSDIEAKRHIHTQQTRMDEDERTVHDIDTDSE